MKIYCPKCRWAPGAGARWHCSKCSTRWNTFETQGRCPGCGHVWRNTQCLACTRWSPHHEWYHDLPPVDVDHILEPQEAEVQDVAGG